MRVGAERLRALDRLPQRRGALDSPAMTIPEFLLDKRLVDRYMAKGLVSRDAVRAARENLPDREDNAEIVAEAEAEKEAAAAAEAETEAEAPTPDAG